MPNEEGGAVSGAKAGGETFQVKGPGYAETFPTQAKAEKAFESLKNKLMRKGERFTLKLNKRASGGKWENVAEARVDESHYD